MSVIAVLNTLLIIMAILISLFFISVFISLVKPHTVQEPVQTSQTQANYGYYYKPYLSPGYRFETYENDESPQPIYFGDLANNIKAQLAADSSDEHPTVITTPHPPLVNENQTSETISNI